MRLDKVLAVFILIARIIEIILSGTPSREAVEKLSKETGVPSEELWTHLPKEFKCKLWHGR